MRLRQWVPNAPKQTGRVVLVQCLAGLLLLATASPALAVSEKLEVTHLFNASLSLTGDCSVSSADSVLDPDCPGSNHPPEGRLFEPQGVATDDYGNIYVVNRNPSEGTGVFHVDIFDSSGHYVTRVDTPQARHIVVDSGGHLYVYHAPFSGEPQVVRFDPTIYHPASAEIAYGSPPIVIRDTLNAGPGMAVNPTNDHFFLRVSGDVGSGPRIIEYGPPVDGVGNEVLDESIGAPFFSLSESPTGQIAIDAARNRLYSVDWENKSGSIPNKHTVIRVINLQAPHELLGTIDGSMTPSGQFFDDWPRFELAVDEGSGDLFAGNLYGNKRIYVLGPDGSYLATIRKPTLEAEYAWVAVDNGEHSPHQGFAFIVNGFAQGRLFAYEPIFAPKPPVVESISRSGVTEEEAVLEATINPEGEATHYVFEYTTQAAFDENGFADAQVAGEGDIGVSGEGVAVFAPATGLDLGTAYRFRVRAENQCEPAGCTDEAQDGFTTFAPYVQNGPCANGERRTGASADLPDCRAYELVTPPSTNGRVPYSPNSGGSGDVFGTWTASPDGESLAFMIKGGVLPGYEGAGALFNGDDYAARRGAHSWLSEGVGLDGTNTHLQAAGGLSPDHQFATTEGSFVPGGAVGDYLRYPDGSLRLVGEGSIATAERVEVHLITAGGSHTIFINSDVIAAPVQLEPNGPPNGIDAIYDRIDGGELRLVSFLPGEVTPTAAAKYEGASTDGSVIAFRFGGADAPLDLRVDGSETLEATAGARSGRAVSCDPGSSLAGGTASFEWLLDGSPIPGASTSSYVPAPEQAGSVLQCVVRAQNAEGGSIAAGRPLVIDEARHGAPPRPPGSLPAPPQAPMTGDVLQCETGTWSADPTFSFQWYRNGAPIAGAETSSYEVQAADERTLLQCGMTGHANGTASVAFAAPREVASPTPPQGGSAEVSNSTDPGNAPQVGDQLLCEEGSWQNTPTFSFQWLRDGAPIPAATAATYTVVAADEGTALQCEVHAANAEAAAAAVSKAAAVAPLSAAALPSGKTEVKGVKAVGSTLECDPGTWQNTPAFSFQWLRDGAPIPAATSSTYTLAVADREAVVQCALTASNADGAVLSLAGGYVNTKPVAGASIPDLSTALAGLSEEGRYLFYLLDGDLYRFDVQSEETIPITDTNDVTPVHVSADGSTTYFLSPSILGEGPNPNGASPVVGGRNLYVARGGSIKFVATVTEVDVKGEFDETTKVQEGGFHEWMEGVDSSGRYASRTTNDGSVLLFESRADLTAFKSGGKRQIYRYDPEGLACLSCDPTGAGPSSDASLLSPTADVTRATSIVPNLSADGQRAFFETDERLVPADDDGLRDVYEWEAEGKGSCAEPGGCLFLISSGKSGRNDYLFGASESGDDVFILTSDLLTDTDVEEAASVYDARVDGGFPLTATGAGECQGEACQPAAVPPSDPTPASSAFEGSGNVKPEGGSGRKRRCPKGKKAAQRAGRPGCVPRHKKHHKRAKTDRRVHR